MFNKVQRAGLVLAGSGAIVAGAVMPAQAATAPGWRISATFAVPGAETVFFSAAASGASNGWATGIQVNAKAGTSFKAIIKRWNGKSWAAVTLPAKLAKSWAKTDVLAAPVGASSPRNVWIFSDLSGAYLRLSGKTWSLGHLPGANPGAGKILEITSTKVFSPTNLWAFGGQDNVTGTGEVTTPYAAHFNGRKWTTSKVPGSGAILAASAVSAGNMWAVVGSPNSLSSLLPFPGSGKPAVVHWGPAGGWTQPAQPTLPAGATLTTVLAQPGGKVLAGGTEKNADNGATPFLASLSGSSWTVAKIGGASATRWQLGSVVPDGHGGLWAVALPPNTGPGSNGSARLWHQRGAKWTIVEPAVGKHLWILAQLVSVPGTSSVWGVGALKNGRAISGLIAVAGATPR